MAELKIAFSAFCTITSKLFRDSPSYTVSAVSRSIAILIACLLLHLPVLFTHYVPFQQELLVNSMFHIGFLLVGLYQCWLAQFNVARRILLLCFTSYLVIASLLWGNHIQLHLFLIIGVFATCYLFERNENRLRIVFSSILVFFYIGFETFRLWPVKFWQPQLVLFNQVTLALGSLLLSDVLQKLLQKQQHSIDNLLAQRLKALNSYLSFGSDDKRLSCQPGRTITVPSMGVLFADLQGFTQTTKYLPVEVLFDFLNQLYTRFDSLAQTYGVDKIKTNGDQYLAICVPCTSTDHLTLTQQHEKRLCLFAMQLVDSTNQICAQFNLPIQIRIGIATGEVITGVMGTNKPIIDVWGNTVNLAARLESSAQKNTVVVCHDTALAISDTLHCDRLSPSTLKGFGKTERFQLYQYNSRAVPTTTQGVLGM